MSRDTPTPVGPREDKLRRALERIVSDYNLSHFSKWCRDTAREALAATQEHQFYPVGNIENKGQIINELRIAGERMEIQAGVLKQWSERFYAFGASLAATQEQRGDVAAGGWWDKPSGGWNEDIPE